jgi:hypothetical protein
VADNPALLDTPVSLFHTATGVAYVDLEIDQHRETWPIPGRQFRAWLRRRHCQRTGEAMGLGTIRSILDLLEARAQFDAPERTIHVRVAQQEDCIYLDLADQRWQVVSNVRIGPRHPMSMSSGCIEPLTYADCVLWKCTQGK